MLNIHKKIEAIFRYMQGDISANPTDLDMLEFTEANLNKLIERKSKMNPAILQHKEKLILAERRNEAIKLGNKKKEREN